MCSNQRHGTNSGNNNQIAGAITYPRRNDNAQPVPIQPRQPTSLQGLLRFAMEATKAEDAPGNSQLGPMDEERRKFLEKALKSLTVNVAEVIGNAIKVLTNTEKLRSIQLGQPLPDDVRIAFADLFEYVDDIDVANDFYKMGGFAIFPICYGSENDEIRALASNLLAECCQNNPACQARALECGLLNVLLSMAQGERGEALAKCLYAISCACREFEPACKELIAQGGVAALVSLLAAPEPAARTKAAFLLRYLSAHYADAKEQLIQNNVVKTLAAQIAAGYDSSTEHFLSTLLALVEDSDETVLQQCRDPSINLQKILEDHLKLPQSDEDAHLEEKAYCRDILKIVFENAFTQSNENEYADR